MYLVHHGVKGMRWGVRRYQNKDGARTPKGRKREQQEYDGQQKKKMSTKKKLAIAGGVALAGAAAYAAYKRQPIRVTREQIIRRTSNGDPLFGDVKVTMPRYKAQKLSKTETIIKSNGKSMGEKSPGKERADALINALKKQNQMNAANDAVRYEAAIKKIIAEHNPKKLGLERTKENIAAIAAMDARQRQLRQRAGEDFTAELLRRNAKKLGGSGAAPKKFSQMTMDELKKLDLY